jgi:hypothetical protein
VVHGSSLLTVPPQQPGGWIRAGFALGRQIAAGDQFTADVGFTQAGGTAPFVVTALMPDGSIPELGRYTGSADGALHHLKLDLSSAAGASILRLRVDEDPNVGNDTAVWVNPTYTSGG